MGWKPLEEISLPHSQPKYFSFVAPISTLCNRYRAASGIRFFTDPNYVGCGIGRLNGSINFLAMAFIHYQLIFVTVTTAIIYMAFAQAHLWWDLDGFLRTTDAAPTQFGAGCRDRHPRADR